MNLQDLLMGAVKEARKNKFDSSPQISLGELIEQLEKCVDADKPEKPVSFDFGSAIPTSLDSWRGSYAELALGYELTGRSTNASWDKMKLSDLLKELKGAVGKTYEGYKGGDFTMDEQTPVWVDNYGESTNTGIIGVHDDGYKAVILTMFMEY